MKAPRRLERLRVLIVEDSEDDALLEVATLEEAYRPTWRRVQDGDDMSQALAASQWDLVLCDHALPRFDSFAALKVLAASPRPDIPMIVVSGAIGEEFAAAVIRAGASAYVNKTGLAQLVTITGTVLDEARARRRAAHVEAELRSAFDDAAFGSAIVKLGTPAGRLLRANRSFCETFGVTSSAVQRLHLATLVHSDDKPAVEQALRDLGDRRTGVFRSELRVQLGAAGDSWFLFSLAVVRDAQLGAPTYAIAQFIDITARKDAEHALALANEQAVKASKMQSAFVANMNHEIRTPLNGVLGITELIARSGLLDAHPEYLSGLRASGSALMAIIEQILDFSRLEAGELEVSARDFDVAALIDAATSVVAPAAAAKGVSLTVSVEPGAPALWHADDARVRQVLLNLLGNAIKFTDSGGKVSVTVRAARGATNGLLRFEVADTGIGIDPSLHARIFDPFIQADPTTSRRYGGSGLGLTIVKQLVELIGGSSGMKSAPGVGSRFWFEFPRAVTAHHRPSPTAVDASTATRDDPPAEPASLDLAPLPVLLAEDDAINQLVACELLEWAHCAVDVAPDGLTAIELAKTHDYRLIFMDCQMPGTDGYQATRAIRRQEGAGHHTPIVAMTAHTMEGDRAQCLAAGMDDYLPKPLEPEALERIVRRWTATPRDRHRESALGAAAARDAHTTQCTLDQARVERLHIDLRAPGALEAAVGIFATQTPVLLAAIRAAAAAGDAPTMREHAHKLKGGCMMLAASRAAELAGQLEQIAAHGSAEAGTPLIDDLQHACEQAQAALAAEVAAHKHSVKKGKARDDQ